MIGNAFDLSSSGLIGLIVIVVAILFVVVIAARLVKREGGIRVTRFGVFIERDRYDEPRGEEVTERHEWPKREEET